MFVGRKQELRQLQALYQTDKFQLPVIYGRRRVGKTALINEFSKGKDVIFFTGIESSAKQNLENLSRAIFNFTSSSSNSPIFASFQDALEYVFELAATRRIILVMDEYPYVAKAHKALGSILQSLIDKHKDHSKLFLILCGSSMSFMEEQVLGYQSPLYGRRTAQFKIQPFSYFESRTYFSHFSDLEMGFIYGVVGGTPQYLLQMDDSLSVEENIKRSILNPNAYLFEEPNNLLKQEVREAAVYNAIISAIASGSTRISEISSKIGEESGACATYIKKLISLGLVRKETPFGEKPSRRTIYAIEDNLFRFWYRFIPSNIALLQNNMIETAYRNMESQFTTHMGPVFEEICKQYLWQLNQHGKAAITFTALGRWWGNDPQKKSETEIDIMGTDNLGNALFCECKWTNEPVDLAVLETLVYRSSLFHHNAKHYYLFSRSGFTEGCVATATAMGNVRLISFEDMMNL